jgi:hypothetical protein
VFKAHRRLYHSTLGSRVVKKQQKLRGSGEAVRPPNATGNAFISSQVPSTLTIGPIHDSQLSDYLVNLQGSEFRFMI